MNIYKEAASLKAEGKAFAIAMIIESKGSTPRSSARMLIKEDGSIKGTIGGGPVEQFVIKNSLEAIREGQNRTCHYTLQMREQEGMHCGGEMTFFIDVEIPGMPLLLVGAGHVNQAVARLAVRTGFNVTVADNREGLLKEDLFPPGITLIYGETLKDAVEKTNLNEGTYVVVATGSEDKEGLKSVLPGNPRHLAMLGSRRKAIMIKKELSEEGWTEEELQQVICPAGLDIGAETPDEIAVSLISQMLMVRTDTDGKELYPSSSSAPLIILRGAGDIATGTICRLHNAGYRVLALETAKPTVIRRTVAFADAVHEGIGEVEGIRARLGGTKEEIMDILSSREVAIAVDPEGELIQALKPAAVIDAILAKKNLGTTRDMAKLTIGLGPGFTAGEDVKYVVETARGHHLGRIIEKGPSLPNTGIPGNIEGYTAERIVRAPSEGTVEVLKDISSIVSKGEVIARVNDEDVLSPLGGMIRGMIRPGTEVTEGMKMGDIDPRGEKADYLTISDKARAIAGSVLEILVREKICPQGSLKTKDFWENQGAKTGVYRGK